MLCVPPPEPYAPPELTRAALYTPFRWRGRSRITVKFLDGPPDVQAAVARIATGPESWNSACGLQVVFVDSGDSDIRITMQRGASWSYVGDYCTHIAQDMPTMQLGWAVTSSQTELQRVVLHEFGHAQIGLMHEHQSPVARIPWLIENVYSYYLATNGWSRAMVDSNVLTKFDGSVVETSEWDQLSIMHYSIPPSIVEGGVRIGGAMRLSPIDRVMAGVWYGLPPMQWRKTYMPQVVS